MDDRHHLSLATIKTRWGIYIFSFRILESHANAVQIRLIRSWHSVHAM
jgi:hypothetical protein